METIDVLVVGVGANPPVWMLHAPVPKNRNPETRMRMLARGDMDVSLIAKPFAFCLLAICLMLSANSLFALANASRALWRGLALAMVLLIELFYFAARPLEARVLRRLCLWSVAVSLVYLAMVARSGGSLGGATVAGLALEVVAGVAVYLALALLWCLLARRSELRALLGSFGRKREL